MGQDNICSVDNCDNPSKTKGLCSGHYARYWASGDVEKHKPLRIQRTGCCVAGCFKPHHANGYCALHAGRVARHGNAGSLERSRQPNKGKLCKIVDCNSQSKTMGYCSKHYQRVQKHGDPNLETNKGKLLPFLEASLSYDGDDCLRWPFSLANGRGQAFVDGERHGAARAMCIMAHGEPPTPEHQSAHSCGKGHEGCVNPKHLRWATATENAADKVSHGTLLFGEASPNAKLTEKDVLFVHEMKCRLMQKEIAAILGVSRSTIGDIISGRTWRRFNVN